HASIQPPVEPFLLLLQDFPDVLLLPGNLRIDLAHRCGEHIDQFVKERLRQSKVSAVADGAAKAAAGHIISVGISRQNPIGNSEPQGSDMIRDNTERNVSLLLEIRAGRTWRWQRRAISTPAELLERIKVRPEDIGLIIRDPGIDEVTESSRTLHDRSHPLKTHHRVDVPL